MKYLLILILLLPNTAFADNLHMYTNTVLILDWLQTREITSNDNFYEKNTLLGKHPTTHGVNQHFIASILLVNVLGEYVLDDNDRYGFYVGISSLQTLNILNNYRVGIRINF